MTKILHSDPRLETGGNFGKITHQTPGAILSGTKRNSDFCPHEGFSVSHGGAKSGKIESLQKEMIFLCVWLGLYKNK